MPGTSPNRASSFSSQTTAPVARSHRNVPSRPASRASRRCSVRSAFCCSIRRRSETSSDAPTIATTRPSASTTGWSRTQIRTGVPSLWRTVKSPSQAPPAFTSVEDRGGTVLLGDGHQHVRDGLADHLVSCPPVQLLGLLVPQEDASVRVGDDDRRVGGRRSPPAGPAPHPSAPASRSPGTPVGPGAADDAARSLPGARRPGALPRVGASAAITPLVRAANPSGAAASSTTLTAGGQPDQATIARNAS